MEITIQSQQPEVLACQGGGEMFKTCSIIRFRTRVDEVGNSSRNPPADIFPNSRDY